MCIRDSLRVGQLRAAARGVLEQRPGHRVAVLRDGTGLRLLAAPHPARQPHHQGAALPGGIPDELRGLGPAVGQRAVEADALGQLGTVAGAQRDQGARHRALPLGVGHFDVDDRAAQRLAREPAARHHQRVVQGLLGVELGLRGLPGGQLLGGGDGVVPPGLRRLPGAHPVAVRRVRPAVALPAVGDPRSRRQRAQQVQTPPDGVPGGPQLALYQGADLFLGAGAPRVVTGHRGGEQPVVEGRVRGRAGRRAQQLTVRVPPRLGALGRLPARYARRRVDPGEQRPQMLVLQHALPGGPMAAQQPRHGQQQTGARHPGPLTQMSEPAAQQRHMGRRGIRRLRLLLGRPPKPHRAPQQPHEVDSRGARHDQLRGVRTQFDLHRDPLAGLRVGLLALLPLHGVREAVHIRQH